MTLQRTAINSVTYGLLGLAACLAASGCRLPGRAADNPLASYDRASISYDIAGGCCTLWEEDSDITPVSFSTEQPATPGTTDDSIWKSAQLSIQFPHPDAVADMAQVTLRLSSQVPDQATPGAAESYPLARGICSDELWVMDIPKGELDQLLIKLSDPGQVEQVQPPAAEAHLNVTINQQKTASLWSREPQLDEFVKRVYQEGRLRGFIPCRQARKSTPQASPRFPALTQTLLQLDQKL